MADQPSTAEWLLGGGGLLALGGGIRWMIEWWGKRDERRQARAERRRGEESVKVSALNARVDHLEDRLNRYVIAVNILIAKEYRMAPNSPELQQVRAILGEAFPLHLHVPADMKAKLDEM